MNSRDLTRIAKHLASGSIGVGRGRPRQTELCRAVSTAYYALFHALALCCADSLVGATPSGRSQRAWRQAYRALEHGLAKNRCSSGSLGRFPPEIQDFGRLFVTMQRERHIADYDPDAAFSRGDVLSLIDETENVIIRFEEADGRDRRAFAVFVLFRLRPD